MAVVSGREVAVSGVEVIFFAFELPSRWSWWSSWGFDLILAAEQRQPQQLQSRNVVWWCWICNKRPCVNTPREVGRTVTCAPWQTGCIGSRTATLYSSTNLSKKKRKKFQKKFWKKTKKKFWKKTKKILKKNFKKFQNFFFLKFEKLKEKNLWKKLKNNNEDVEECECKGKELGENQTTESKKCEEWTDKWRRIF